MLQARGIDTAGLQVVPGGKTFRWRGKYLPNMNDRETLDLQLNVLQDFDPVLPERYRRCKFLFLANGSPVHQLKMLDQCPGPSLVVADTMDHYIRTEPDGLRKAAEADRRPGAQRQRGQAADRRRQPGPGRQRRPRDGPAVRGHQEGRARGHVLQPARDLRPAGLSHAHVVDPTGAGDSFAGGMMGYLAEHDNFDPKTLKEAMAYGTLAASFTVEDFSLDRLRKIAAKDLDRRMEEYKRMLSF